MPAAAAGRAAHGERGKPRRHDAMDRFAHGHVPPKQWLEQEQDHEGDQQGEQRHGLGEREAQHDAREHAAGGLGVTQRARDEAAEDVADADADARRGRWWPGLRR